MVDDLGKGTRLGDYELVLRIGRGGMANVWVARKHGATPEQDRLVTVKAMLADLAEEPDFRSMFYDEVRLVRAIRHPNVVDVIDVGEQSGILYMVMEWVEGEALHGLIAEAGKRRPIPWEIAVRIIADAANGLHAAHELRDADGEPQGVVHRDVSPHNILISTSGRVKLVDFGVAKAVGRLSQATRAGQLKGKFGYMAPEQATGQGVDRRSDVFSLGIVLFELTTNRRLFRGDSDLETLRLVISGEIPRPTKIIAKYPPALEAIVMKALERDVGLRYQTADELRKDLEAFLRAERTVVPRSGVAGLLKRVMGDRIEQRRKAVRAGLRSLETASGARQDLLPNDFVFTPTGHESSSVSNVTSASGVSGLSGGALRGTPSRSNASVASGPAASRPRSSAPRHSRPELLVRRSSWLGYAIGALGLFVAAVVLFAYWGDEATSRPPQKSLVEASSAGVGATAPSSERSATSPSTTRLGEEASERAQDGGTDAK